MTTQFTGQELVAQLKLKIEAGEITKEEARTIALKFKEQLSGQREEIKTQEAERQKSEFEYVNTFAPEMSPLEAVAVGAGRGFANVGHGIKTLSNKLTGGRLVSDEDLATAQQKQDANKMLLKAGTDESLLNKIMLGTGQIGGETIATGIPATAAMKGAGQLTGKALSVAPSLVQKVGTLIGGGVAEGATVAGLLGEDVKTGAAIGAGGNLLAEPLTKAVGAIWRKTFGRDATEAIIDEAGNLTQAAKAELAAAGIPEEQLTQEIADHIKQNFTPEVDLAVQTRAGQLEEFAPGVSPKPSTLSRDVASQNAELSLINQGQGDAILAAEQRTQEALENSARDMILGDIDSGMISRFDTVSDDVNKSLLGESVKEAVGEVKTREHAAVRELYKTATDLAGGGTPIDIKPLNSAFNVGEIELGLPADSSTRKAVLNAFKEFGLLDEGTEMFDAARIPVGREIQDLTLDNAETLRQRLNKIKPTDPQEIAFVSILKKQLDDQVDGMLSKSLPGSVSAKAFQEARKASANYKQMFNDKDFIAKLIDSKKGSTVSIIPEERVIDYVMGSNVSIKQVQSLKKLLLENPTKNSKQAWSDVQFTTLDELLRRSINKDTGKLMGANLNTQLKKIGDERLKLILGNAKFNQLKRFQQVLSDQTIPLKRGENPSGTSGGTQAALDKLGQLFSSAASMQTGGVSTIAQSGLQGRIATAKAINDMAGSTAKTVRAKKAAINKKLYDYLLNLIPVAAVAAQPEQEQE